MITTILPDGRRILPEGTILKFEYQGGCYKILGEPVGYGGAGIIYPAVRVVREGEGWKEEEMWVALKECYPLSTNGVLIREEQGAIRCADEQDTFSAEYYAFAKEMMRKEKETTGRIFNKGFRLTPIWDIMEQEEIAIDGEHFYPAENQYGIMERLDEKGTSLGSILRTQAGGCLTAYASVSILVQILQAIKEVHESGFLHGDIQENNIFLKGVDLSQEEEGVVTLIDFGTARRLLKDGMTDIIGDKKLYTTNGYCAPECSYGNDGTLRLSKAADLYSVGYLMLRMLNGKTLDAKALQLVINGKYIYARQAKKIGCPSGSLDAVNRILEKALKQKPEERYQTADEMLEDLKRLERALAPEKSAIASVDYEAFISYCHEEKSSWAADLIQKKIERYKIPKSVQRMSGKKKMGKVFRDREELSSSSDMEVHLKEALDHSAFLIVLLSPKVPQSPWVAREMEMFLQNHDREHILTILVDGELEEAFPETLRKNEKFDGRQMKMQSVESLAADIRGMDKQESRKKLKTEIYRLLAPMLGCSYDDLRQRQKEYQLQRTIKSVSAAAVVLGAAAGYMGWQAVQIQENYWKTLEEKSRYLAKVSGELLESGDRMAAIQVALEALPDSEADKSKPHMPEAEAALAQAVYAYQGWMMRNEYLRGHGVMKAETPLTEHSGYSEDGIRFFSVDENQSLYIWDIGANALEWKVESSFWAETGVEPFIHHVSFEDDDTLLVVTKSQILHLDIDEKQMKQAINLQDQLDRYSYEDTICVLTKDGKQLAVYDYIRQEGSDYLRDTVFRLFDLTDGTLLHSAVIDKESMGVEYHTNREIHASADGRYLALAMNDFWGMGDEYIGVVVLYDTDTETFSWITSKEVGYQDVYFTEDDHLVIYGNNADWAGLGEQQAMSEIVCYDLQAQEEIWRYESLWQTLFGAPSDIQPAAGEGSVLVWNNRQLLCMDIKTGEILHQCASEKRITGVQNWLEGAYILGTEDGTVYGYEPGGIGFCELGTNVRTENDQFFYDHGNKTAFLISKKNGSVTCLAQIGDMDMEIVEIPYPTQGVGIFTGEAKDYLVIDGENTEEDTNYRTIFDAKDHREIYSWNRPNTLGHSIFDEKKEIYYDFERGNGDQFINAIDLKAQELKWKMKLEDYFSEITFATVEDTEEMLAICYSGSGFHILNLDTQTWMDKVETDTLPCQEERINRRINDLQVTEDGRYIVFTEYYKVEGLDADQAALHVYDRQEGRIKELMQQLETYTFAADYQDAFWLAAKENLAAVYDESGKQLVLLDLDEMKVVECVPFQAVSRRQVAFVNQDQKLVLWGDDGHLKLWNRAEAKVEMVDERQLYSVDRILVFDKSGILEVKGYEEEDLSYVMGMEWCKCWYLMDEEGHIYPYTKVWYSSYSQEADQFYGTLTGQSAFLCYDRYSLDELLEKGRKVIGELELSDVEKMQYYIE